jgi:hypothetical protein
MRRKFNDLARAARVEAIVTRSISGHLTERMQHQYSTVRPDEQRQSIARVISYSARLEITRTVARHPPTVPSTEPRPRSWQRQQPASGAPTHVGGALNNKAG